MILIKYIFTLGFSSTVATVAAALLLAGCLDTSTPQDRAYEKEITNNLVNDGDSIAVSEVHPGEWTKVCKVMEYDRVSRVAAEALGISYTDVKITNTFDDVASSEQWGFVFIYPPDKAEYLRISHHFFSAGADCVPQAVAAFELVRKENGIKRLRLIEKE